MIQLEQIDKSFGLNTVLDKASLQVNAGEKVGLIGANGTGKTTLLRIMLGAMEPDGGNVVTGGPLRIGMLSQEVTLKPYETLLDAMRRALPDIMEMEKELTRLEEEMIAFADDGDQVEAIVEQYGKVQERYEAANGRDLSWKIDTIIQGLGFSLNDKNRKTGEFSGGWQMRIELARLLLQEIDLLLLDEPTNHLDLGAVTWLEEYFREIPGAVVIVSHDRYFLNRVVSRILHLEKGHVFSYTGNYDAYAAQRLHERELHEKAYVEQQKRLAQERRFIERFRYKATLASRVKSKEKMIEKRVSIAPPEGKNRTMAVSFENEKKNMTTPFRLKDIEKAYDRRLVSLLGEIEISGGERIAIVGNNGSGKSTLLRILSGEESHYRGKLKAHPDILVAHYHQNHQDALHQHLTVLEELQEAAPSGFSVRELRTMLGCMLFRGDDVFKKVSVLSGGEKARLALAQIVTSPSNVLLLDEPTNHLDIDSREALADALEGYEGTIIIVSHDRFFLDQVCARVVEIENGSLVSYPGNYTYYSQKKKATEKAKLAQKYGRHKGKSNILKPGRHSTAEIEARRNIQRRVSELEERIMQTEHRIKEIESLFEDPRMLQDRVAIQELSKEFAQKRSLLEELFEEYGEAHTIRDSLP